MQQLHDNYAASTKALIREVLERALNPGSVLQPQVSSSVDSGGSGGAAGGDFSVVQALQGLGHEDFLQVPWGGLWTGYVALYCGSSVCFLLCVVWGGAPVGGACALWVPPLFGYVLLAGALLGV